MHLKSLTVKGFKSFASATTLRLEPGITCVVGPNGSGKSNVVDAIAWVLGEQGAKALRGGKMEDVIFAGTAGRAPLGRAEVTLTIDNTDGALPIDYTEVSITRRMFRSGESEYEINGDSCRLLDIQELLSDSGIGREMHVIVGQGQLDAVLHAKPEDRRAFIEEAAGVLKHRKRKEKALRKLDAMQANLNRLTDLTAELRRQLKPLGRQAEVARRAAGIQADLRDARLRLLADDLATLRDDARQGDRRRDRAARAARGGRGASTRRSSARLAELEARARRGRAGAGRRAGRPGTSCPRCRSASARPSSWPASGCAHLSRRRRRTSGPAATPTSWPPRPSGSASRRTSCARRSTDDQARLSRGGRAPAGAGAPARRGRAGAGRGGQGDRRPARGPGQADRPGQRRAHPHRPRPPRRSSGSPPRYADAHGAGRGGPGGRRRGRRRAPPRPTATTPTSTPGTPRRSPRTTRPTPRVTRADRRRARGREGRRQLEGPRGGARARPAPQGRRRRAAGPGRPGARPARQRRRAADASSPGYEAALAAALGALADAVAVSGVDEAAEAMRLLKIRRRRPGRAARRRPGRPGTTARSTRCARRCPTARAGRSTWSAAPDASAPAVAPGAARRRPRARPRDGDRALVVVRTRAARGHARRRRARRVRGGRRLGQAAELHRGAGRRRGGPRTSATTPRQSIAELREQLAAARGAGRRAPRRPSDAAAAAKRAAEGERNAAARRLAELGAAARSAQGRGRAARRRAGTRPSRPATATSPRLAELEERLRSWPRTTPIDDGTVHRGARPAGRAGAAGPAERDGGPARRAHRRGAGRRARRPRRLAAAPGRRRAGGPRAGRRPPGRPGPRRRRSPSAVAVGAREALRPGRRCAGGGRRAPRRSSPQARVRARGRADRRCAAAAKRLGAELERLTSEVHRDEVARAEQRMRIEQLEAKAAEDFALDVETLLGEYGPHAAGTADRAPRSPRPRRTASRRPSRCRSTGRPRRSGPPRPSAS